MQSSPEPLNLTAAAAVGQDGIAAPQCVARGQGVVRQGAAKREVYLKRRAAETLREARCVPQLDEHDDEEAETFRGAAPCERRHPLARVTSRPCSGLQRSRRSRGSHPAARRSARSAAGCPAKASVRSFSGGSRQREYPSKLYSQARGSRGRLASSPCEGPRSKGGGQPHFRKLNGAS